MSARHIPSATESAGSSVPAWHCLAPRLDRVLVILTIRGVAPSRWWHTGTHALEIVNGR